MVRLTFITFLLFLSCDDNGIAPVCIEDSCGICDGDNSTCSGCTVPFANNYDNDAIVDDASCTFDDSYTYNDDVKTIFDNNCIGCHDSTSPAGGLTLLSYLDISNSPVIEPGNYFDSRLYDLITRLESEEDEMPPGQASLTQVEIDMIAQWIYQNIPEKDN